MGMRFAVLVLSFSGALSQCTTSYYTNVVSACDLLNSSNTDVTRFCSGACNTALNTASNGCSASVPSEAPIKQTADNSLSYCSGCMFHYSAMTAACDLSKYPDNTDYQSVLCGAGECNTALTSAAAACTSPEHAQIKTGAEQSLATCSGSDCMSHYYAAMAACDFDNPANADNPANLYSLICSDGACNSALTSAAAACTSPDQAQIKAMADTSLAMCSGCMSHAMSFASACPGVMTMDDSNEDQDGMANFLTAHAVVCGGGACYDLLTQASNDCDASNPNDAFMNNASTSLLGFCSGCPDLTAKLFNACPEGFMQIETPTGANISQLCSGACKAAINSVSSGCDASMGTVQGGMKAGADLYLAYCQPPVVLTLTASGDPSDYADTTALAASIASSAGVDVSLVTIVVAPGSVVITATIATPPGTTPTAVESSLASALGTDATTASAALGITVEAAPTVAITPYPVPSPSPPPPSAPPSPLSPPPPSVVATADNQETSGSGRAQPSLLMSFVLGLVALASAR